MRWVVALVLIGLVLTLVGVWVMPTQDIGGPGERPTSYLYVFYAGAACVLLAALLAAREAWKSHPSAPAVAFLVAIGFVAIGLGAGSGGQAGPVLFASGVALETFAVALGVRSLWRRGRSGQGVG